MKLSESTGALLEASLLMHRGIGPGLLESRSVGLRVEAHVSVAVTSVERLAPGIGRRGSPTGAGRPVALIADAPVALRR